MILRSQGLNDVGWTLQSNIHVEEQYVEAKEVSEKFVIVNMGWKDPRTTLFLDFW